MGGKIIIGLRCTVFFLTILPVPCHALTPAQVFDKVKDSVVVVKTLDAGGKVKLQGSGVLLSSGGVATNCHVVEGGVSYWVGRGNQLISATLYSEDADRDICILDAKGITGKPVQFGKTAALKVGDPVFAVGAPRGLELSLSDGIVAQLRGGPPPLIQTTTAISPGSSGGGLFDGEGRLVGLTTLYVEGGQNLNFAMPVEWIGEVKPGRTPVVTGISQTEWLKRAIALEDMEDWNGVIDWCRKWTENEPKSSWAWYGLGVGYGKLNRNNDAIMAFRQYLRIAPGDVGAWYNLGTIYDKLNRSNDAIKSYQQALRIDPENAKKWFNLGIPYYRLNRNNDAIEAYRQALRINPKLIDAWYNLGIVYYRVNRNNDAINAFQQALRIDPKYDDAWYNLAVAYYNADNYTAALDAVRELRRLDPERADRLFNRIVPR